MDAGAVERRADQCRVEAARQQQAYRDVAHQAPLDGAVEALRDRRRCRGDRRAVRLRHGQTPVRARRGVAARRIDREQVPRRQLVHAAEDRARRRDEVQQQVAREGLRVESRPRVQRGQDRLGLGAEQEALAFAGVVERLLPEPVARDEQPAPAAVPHREREHAVQAFDDRVAPRAIAVEDHLHVAVGAERVTEQLELATKLALVVDLGVRDQDDAVVRAHGLRAAVDVHDRQARVGQAEAGFHVRRRAVRPASTRASRPCARRAPGPARARRWPGCRRFHTWRGFSRAVR